jgi:hypothetical protein
MDDEEEEKPAKKAKKMRQYDDEDSSDEASPTRLTKKSKAMSKSRTLSDGVVGINGRRKSGPVDPKNASRQNLTEEEKKMNHIRSEQKRRNQIKEGFADLTTMMPDSSAGASKCAILSQAVDWLSGLIEGNEQLRAQLETMQ